MNLSELENKLITVEYVGPRWVEVRGVLCSATVPKSGNIYLRSCAILLSVRGDMTWVELPDDHILPISLETIRQIDF